MKLAVRRDNTKTWPDPWQMMLVALCALILCSCRGPAVPQGAPYLSSADTRAPRTPDTMMLPREAYTGAPEMAAPPIVGPPGMEAGVPLAYTAAGPWAPPGLRQPWPEDEYLRDGGDEGLPTGVSGQGEVLGLEMEDAVAHYDTLDGRRIVEPSNEVYIYSPRFGAVRQVVGLVSNEERQKAGGVDVPIKLQTPASLQLIGSTKQNIQPEGQIAARPPVALLSRQNRDVMSSALGPKSFQSSYQAYEDLTAIRLGRIETGEMPYLARGSTAAIAWDHTQAVQVILDHKGVMAEVKYDSSLSLYTVSEPPGCPKLRIVKVASTQFAEPGDEVDFTLRFDNIGNQPIGNVTILDNLNTRLEYVAQSAQCSREAKFSTTPNDGGSVVVRCEVSQPVKPGEGGVLRFRCRVR